MFFEKESKIHQMLYNLFFKWAGPPVTVTDGREKGGSPEGVWPRLAIPSKKYVSMLQSTILFFTALRVNLGDDTFPIGVLKDGRRVATPYGVEFRQEEMYTVLVSRLPRRPSQSLLSPIFHLQSLGLWVFQSKIYIAPTYT